MAFPDRPEQVPPQHPKPEGGKQPSGAGRPQALPEVTTSSLGVPIDPSRPNPTNHPRRYEASLGAASPIEPGGFKPLRENDGIPVARTVAELEEAGTALAELAQKLTMQYSDFVQVKPGDQGDTDVELNLLTGLELIFVDRHLSQDNYDTVRVTKLPQEAETESPGEYTYEGIGANGGGNGVVIRKDGDPWQEESDVFFQHELRSQGKTFPDLPAADRLSPRQGVGMSQVGDPWRMPVDRDEIAHLENYLAREAASGRLRPITAAEATDIQMRIAFMEEARVNEPSRAELAEVPDKPGMDSPDVSTEASRDVQTQDYDAPPKEIRYFRGPGYYHLRLLGYKSVRDGEIKMGVVELDKNLRGDIRMTDPNSNRVNVSSEAVQKLGEVIEKVERLEAGGKDVDSYEFAILLGGGTINPIDKKDADMRAVYIEDFQETRMIEIQQGKGGARPEFPSMIPLALVADMEGHLEANLIVMRLPGQSDLYIGKGDWGVCVGNLEMFAKLYEATHIVPLERYGVAHADTQDTIVEYDARQAKPVPESKKPERDAHNVQVVQVDHLAHIYNFIRSGMTPEKFAEARVKWLEQHRAIPNLFVSLFIGEKGDKKARNNYAAGYARFLSQFEGLPDDGVISVTSSYDNLNKGASWSLLYKEHAPTKAYSRFSALLRIVAERERIGDINVISPLEDLSEMPKHWGISEFNQESNCVVEIRKGALLAILDDLRSLGWRVKRDLTLHD